MDCEGGNKHSIAKECGTSATLSPRLSSFFIFMISSALCASFSLKPCISSLCWWALFLDTIPPEMVNCWNRNRMLRLPRCQSLFHLCFQTKLLVLNLKYRLGRMDCISSPKFISSNISPYSNPFSFSGHVWSCLILQSSTWNSCQRSPSDESRDLFATLLPDFS